MSDDRLAFKAVGPIDVPYQQERGGRVITTDACLAVFEEEDGLGEAKGCYIFAMRSSRGALIPWYVGKTTSGFRRECFTPDKLNKYHRALAMSGHGTPVLVFIVAPKGRGRPNAEGIDQLETHLIQLAAEKNKRLLNKTKKEGRWWFIQGFGQGRGRPNGGAAALTKMMK